MEYSNNERNEPRPRVLFDKTCEKYNTRSTARDDVTRTLCYGRNFAFPSRLREKTEQGYIQAVAQLYSGKRF